MSLMTCGSASSARPNPLAMAGGRNQAEDIAQEAFARALIPAAVEGHAQRVGLGRVVRQRPL